MKHIVAAICTLFIVSGAAAQIPAATVPDFTLYRMDKTVFKPKDLTAGKPLFFVFFDTECDHCQHAMQYLGIHQQELDKAAVYLISLAPPERMNAFINKYGPALKNKPNVVLLQDRGNDFILKFRPKKYPSMFLYTAKKQLVVYDDNEQNLNRILPQIKTAASK